MEREALYGDRDIMLLILLVVEKLDRAVSFDEIWRLLFVDDNISYFDYCTCIDRLVENKQLTLDKKGMYSITDDGRVNLHNLECYIPKNIRAVVETDTALQHARERREASIVTHSYRRFFGEYDVVLGLDDDVSQVFRLQIIAPDKDSADKMMKTFRKHPEAVFDDILACVFKERDEKEE